MTQPEHQKRLCFVILSNNCRCQQIFLLPPLNGGTIGNKPLCWQYNVIVSNLMMQSLVSPMCSQLKCSCYLYAAKPYWHNNKCLGPLETLRGTEEIMCSHILTPEELSEVKMLQMSKNTLRGSHDSTETVIWLEAAGVNICLPTHFILSADKNFHWTKLKETD